MEQQTIGEKVDLRTAQSALKERYRQDPESARFVTAAQSVECDPSDPRHCAVAPSEFLDATIRSGLHRGTGGSGDVPCSGDILASSLAICEEATIRSVAHNMGIPLESVHVEVRIHWDFRGTLGVDREVPVGATGIELISRVRVKEGVDAQRAERFLRSAERYCATLQTLRNGVKVDTSFELSSAS